MTTLTTNAEAVLEGLSEAQRVAASYLDGPLIIVAGPGSGKTRVMSHRMAYILATGVAPWRALGVTFTNKAAAELRERCNILASRFIPNAAETNVSTFHSFGARFLRIHHDAADLSRDFTIYDRDDQERMLKLIIADMDVDDAKVGEVLSSIQKAKNNNQTPDDFASIGTGYRHELHAEIYQLYESELRKSNGVDFDDLLLKPYRVLVQDEHIRSEMQDRYQHIMVDEFQDTNALQFELVRVLGDVHRNICVVGDPDQSIYSWRNARPENMDRLAEILPGCKIFELSESYRSTKTIIGAASGLISHNARKIERVLFTNNEQGEPVEIGVTEHPEHEASVILDVVERQMRSSAAKNGVGNLDNVAVLYRTNAQSRALETECSRRGVQYRLIGGMRFYERREIKDALALLRIVVNPTDETSLRRVINVPPRGIGPATLRKLEEHSLLNDVTLLDAVLLASDPGDSHRLELGRAALSKVGAFADFVRTLVTNAETLYPNDLLDYALKGSGYNDWVQKDEETRHERFQNLDELKLLTEKYSNPEDGAEPRQALSDLLEHTALFANVDTMDEGIGADQSNLQSQNDAVGAITLITLHQAKGLEFDTVFIAGVTEGLLPHAMALNVQSQDDYEAACGEERRLMYVGMTRAKRKLHIMWPLYTSASLYRRGNTPSQFLKEIPEEHVKEVEYARVPGRTAPPPIAFSSSFGVAVDRDSFAPSRPRREREKFTERGITDLPEELQLKAGQRVKHSQFGTGVVVNSRPVGDDLRVTVAFSEEGVKILMASMANLEKIQGR